MTRRPSLQTLEVLSIMLDSGASAQHYGLELAKKAKIPTGTIYPILRRLETQGWVSSTWEQVNPKVEGRPRKRLYELTGLGAQEAKRNLQRVQISFARPAIGGPTW